MANKTNWTDMDSRLPEVPSVIKDSLVIKYLEEFKDVTPPTGITYKQITENSKSFPRKFPIETVKSKTLKSQKHVTEDLLVENANSAYPLLHEAALYLCIDFLEHKKKYGVGPEIDVYGNMGLMTFVQRLLEKRAVSFFATYDKYLLLNGAHGVGGWEPVGTEEEKSPLLLKQCLSYDEMKLSALLSVSSWSYFINDGSRQNRGVPEKNTDSLTTRGIIIGLIGARLKRLGLMELQEVLVTKEQNTKENGYGPPSESGSAQQECLQSLRQLWANFYGIKPHLPLFEDAVKVCKSGDENALKQYRDLNNNKVFNNTVYRRRLTVSIETLLLEAEARAVSKGTKAYLHVVGIGLGVWRATDHQETEFLAAFASCLRRLRSVIPHVSDINFVWFMEGMKAETWKGITEATETGPGINIIFSKREPHSKLSDPEDEGKLLVVSYAWDGNALPGNEFWMKNLASSGDSAAACSTQITELHNPHINKSKVSAANLHIASPKWGVLHVAEYVQKMLAGREASNSKM